MYNETKVNIEDGRIKNDDFYGKNVFCDDKIRRSLSQDDYLLFQNAKSNPSKMDKNLAGKIALAAKDWALANGVTHFCHWFMPQARMPAEKHDAFLSYDNKGKTIQNFSGSNLLQAEPDASSFPSGGLRNTAQARGYTVWDLASPMFISEKKTGKTLYIPAGFIGYHGEALDHKIPMLRSHSALSKEIIKTLGFLGERNVSSIKVNIGAEQEFFLVPKKAYENRIDLRLTGRSLCGDLGAKGQELEEHYFGAIPDVVQTFFHSLESKLYKLGVPLKTRHNEVAPGQFEIAPLYEDANVATDHNLMLMHCLKETADENDLAVLLHEKPFAGVNGSGKHVNWSICDSNERNLLDPKLLKTTPNVFLAALAGVLLGVHDNADVIRSTIAGAGNDHRLGANEAPPAILSVFMGNYLDRMLNAIENGVFDFQSPESEQVGLGVLPDFSKDSTDRNRTSPFAFTGNKFEFRAVGSSAVISYPIAILNAAVCDGFKKLNEKISQKSKDTVVSSEALRDVIKDIVIQTKKIRFEGNGYSQEWKNEAKSRGLSNFATTPAALEVLTKSANTQFLLDTKTFTEKELHSRTHIQFEKYVKDISIEVRCLLDIAKTKILPVCFEYLNTLLSIEQKWANAASEPASAWAVKELNEKVCLMQKSVSKLENSFKSFLAEELNEVEQAKSIEKNVLPSFAELRKTIDLCEEIIPSNNWPLVKYTDLLFKL